MNNSHYNREKSLAILTGLICLLICLSGTIIGIYNAFNRLDLIPAILASCCNLIADLVIIWASYIDYSEDHTALEWAAWGIKYPLAFYLLFSGALILYTLGQNADYRDAIRLASDAQKICLENKGGLNNCQKVYQATLKTPSKQNVSEANVSIEKFISLPFFHYIPGGLGLVGMLILTFIPKLLVKKETSFPLKEVSFSGKEVSKSKNIFPKNNQIGFSVRAQSSGKKVYNDGKYIGHITHRQWEKYQPKTPEEIVSILKNK